MAGRASVRPAGRQPAGAQRPRMMRDSDALRGPAGWAARSRRLRAGLPWATAFRADPDR